MPYRAYSVANQLGNDYERPTAIGTRSEDHPIVLSAVPEHLSGVPNRLLDLSSTHSDSCMIEIGVIPIRSDRRSSRCPPTVLQFIASRNT